MEAPLDEADDGDAEDLSNLLRMSLCAPELETRRTTGLRPGVVVRSGIAPAAAALAPRSTTIKRELTQWRRETGKSALQNRLLRPLPVSFFPLSGRLPAPAVVTRLSVPTPNPRPSM